MNNFFEKALAIKRRYCQAAIELGTDIYGPGYDVDTFNPYKDAKVEILSRLVATYFMYDGNIPNKFFLLNFLILMIQIGFYVHYKQYLRFSNYI